MREHKYKVLDKSSQEFISDDGLTLKEIQNINNLDHFEFYEYTGLKDKNGVEIYEGDIVKDKDGLAHKVFYNERFTCFELMATGNCLGFYNNTLSVIGNIYENPELL